MKEIKLLNDDQLTDFVKAGSMQVRSEPGNVIGGPTSNLVISLSL